MPSNSGDAQGYELLGSPEAQNRPCACQGSAQRQLNNMTTIVPQRFTLMPHIQMNATEKRL
jgi:hypothetical protein